MEFTPPLRPGILRRRYKRFLADIVTSTGELLTIHCPNTGAMTGCDTEGSRIWYSTAASASRKYAHTLEIVEAQRRHWVGVNSARANSIVREALERGRIEELSYAGIDCEVAIPDGSGRFDFRLRFDDCRSCFVEVKSVTLDLGDGLGAFPDAKSVRALRHVTALRTVRAAGHRAVLLFCVQHNGVDRLTTADAIDPAYGAALRVAHSEGVEVIAYRAQVSPERIELEEKLAVVL